MYVVLGLEILSSAMGSRQRNYESPECLNRSRNLVLAEASYVRALLDSMQQQEAETPQ